MDFDVNYFVTSEYEADFSQRNKIVSHLELTPEELLGPLNEIEFKNAPARLYCIGDLNLANTPKVSIVGSRAASKEGLIRTKRLSTLLVQNGVTVVSGLARGVDAAAHTAAMQNEGRTIAVIGTAINKTYPAEHKKLQQEIASSHLLVSQFAPDERTFPSSFTQRNRTMALITHATIIIEASEKSGTIHQGWEAIRLGRPLFMLKSLIDTKLKWVEDMMYYGARMLSDDTIEDLLESLPVCSQEAVDVFAL